MISNVLKQHRIPNVVTVTHILFLRLFINQKRSKIETKIHHNVNVEKTLPSPAKKYNITYDNYHGNCSYNVSYHGYIISYLPQLHHSHHIYNVMNTVTIVTYSGYINSYHGYTIVAIATMSQLP